MKIKIELENMKGAGCNNGRYPAYRLINEAGEVVGEGVTCNCGRGCSGTDDLFLEKWIAEKREEERND